MLTPSKPIMQSLATNGRIPLGDTMLFTSTKPMLLSSQNEAFNDDHYIFEPKWDGWRILLHKKGKQVEAYTKNGNCVTHLFPELQDIGKSIQADAAILDCEGVCIRDQRPNFDDFAYRGRLKEQLKINAAAHTHPATFEPHCVRIQYQDRTDTHHLRNVNFKGFLFEKNPEDCRWLY